MTPVHEVILEEHQLPRLAFSLPEVAEILAISLSQVKDLVTAGRLRPMDLGSRTVRIARCELERFCTEVRQDAS